MDIGGAVRISVGVGLPSLRALSYLLSWRYGYRKRKWYCRDNCGVLGNSVPLYRLYHKHSHYTDSM